MGVQDWKTSAGGESLNTVLTQKGRTTFLWNGYSETFVNPKTLLDKIRYKSRATSPVVVFKGISNWRHPMPYERYVCKFTHTPGKWHTLEPFGDSHILREIEGYQDVQSNVDGAFNAYGRRSVDNNLMNRARVEACLKLYERKASLGASLAEAVAAADDMAILASRAFRSLIRGKRAIVDMIGKGLSGNGVSGNYLMAHFGLVPLYGDIKGTYEVLGEKLRAPLTLKGKRSISQSFHRTGSWFDAYYKNVSDKGSERAMVSITATVDNAELIAASSIGLTDPLGVAWELVPWSFAIDWLMPVGNCLAALDSVKGLGFVGGSETSVVNGRFYGEQRSNWIVDTPQITEADYICHRRAALPGFPVVRPYTKSPFSTSHVTTAIALWRQLTK